MTSPPPSPGSYYLLFVADSGGDQAEADETDNVRAVPITLVGSSSKSPDMVITAATAPNSAELGNINVSWTVKNQGTGDVSGFWEDDFYLSTDQTFDGSDTYIRSYTHFNSPAAGASQSFDATLTLPGVPAGPYYLLFVADAQNNVSESDETNNVRAVPIILTVPDVDLVVTAADAPVTAKAGATVDLSWTVENQGHDAASSSWFDYVYLSTDDQLDFSDTYVTDSYVSNATPLAPGAGYSRDEAITLPSVPAGRYYLLFVANGDSGQTETDGTNNVRAIPITLTALDVDLAITGSASPTSANPGTIQLSWTVTNQGSDPIESSWFDYIYLSYDQTYDFSDSYMTSAYHFGSELLGAGASYTIDQTANLPARSPGDYYLLFIIDQNNAVSETNETNNVRAVPIKLTASNVDLAVTAADAPATAKAGATAAVSWTAKNQGTDAATAAWTDAVYLSTDDKHDFSDQYVGVWFVSNPLAAGASYSHDTSISVPPVQAGEYYLLFITDVGNSQIETDETNNLRAVRITIEAADAGSKVDLAVSDATAPGSAAPGHYIPVTWIVTNAGAATAGTSWQDAVYLSTDATFDPAGDTPLATISTASQSPLPNGRGYIVSMDVFLPGSTAPGDYHLLFVANSAADQAESSRATTSRPSPSRWKRPPRRPRPCRRSRSTAATRSVRWSTA